MVFICKSLYKYKIHSYVFYYLLLAAFINDGNDIGLVRYDIKGQLRTLDELKTVSRQGLESINAISTLKN